MNARDAANHGAVIKTRTRAVAAEPSGTQWSLTTEDRTTGARETIQARVLINAAGPWVGQMLALAGVPEKRGRVRLVQGSHIVLPKLYAHDRCYIFQNADGRIIFAIPYENDFTLIGTTDHDYAADPAAVTATPDEIDYLCAAASEYFEAPVEAKDVVWSYSGVRSLFDDGASAAQAATRDYVLDLDTGAGPPLLSIFGGKITTYRRLALHALEKLSAFLPPGAAAKAGWTGREPLPGGDFPIDGLSDLQAGIARQHPWLAAADLRRLTQTYGTRASVILEGAAGYEGLGESFGAGLYAAEIRYLMGEEWAETGEDVVWRRTKLGLRLSAEEIGRIDSFMAEARRLTPGA